MAAKSKKAKKEEAQPLVETPQDNELTALSEKDLLNRLIEKLSCFDAEMILSSAMISAGVLKKGDECFKKKEVRTICLELIKKGGPAFSVGTLAYREFLG